MTIVGKVMEAFGKDVIPSIKKQTRWRAEFTNFGKAEGPGIRYFNTTIIQRGDEEWMIARKAESLDYTKHGRNSLVAFKLDSNRTPTHFIPIKLDTLSYKDQHFEDPRVTVMGGKPWLSYCTFQITPVDRYSGAHQQVATLSELWQPENRWDPIYGNNGGSIYTGSGNEKNWVWFEHDQSVHLIYDTEPHTVVRWEGDQVAEVYKTPCPPWNWGHKRGGSSPVRIGDEYLCFFHSSTMWNERKRRYHMGAYCFEAKPPFRITRATRKPLLSGSREDPWAEGLPLVVFPCGAIYKSGGFWVVTMGINDYCTAWIEIPHCELEPLMSI